MFKLALFALLASERGWIQNITVLQQKNESTTVAVCPLQTNIFFLIRPHVDPVIRSQHNIEDTAGQDSQWKVGERRMENRDMAPPYRFCGVARGTGRRSWMKLKVQQSMIQILPHGRALQSWLLVGRVQAGVEHGLVVVTFTLQREVGWGSLYRRAHIRGSQVFERRYKNQYLLSSTAPMGNH